MTTSDSRTAFGPAQVLVVDDDPLVREVYRAVLAQVDDFEVAGEARTGAEGVRAYEALQPDVVLMDLQMPVLDGIEATRQICARWPTACIVVLTTFGTREHITAALRAGAAGYLLKDTGGQALRTALHQALAGQMPLSSSVRRELVAVVTADQRQGPGDARPAAAAAAAAGLTLRERDLLQWLARGLTNQQIGNRMHLSEGSVKQLLSRIGGKLESQSRTQTLIRALRLGLIDLADLDDHDARH